MKQTSSSFVKQPFGLATKGMEHNLLPFVFFVFGMAVMVKLIHFAG